ncbi:hypothetical protein JVT61DRAFT_10372 [Boletus reticuloceps]|uniref:Uncharacterized protein n=1 Tax=Boletus reticuloceps TaxID=495285 RepID=A0A8I2YUU7_9AGAM|nr:hypothetical protein JVT61DRAFT_10372 [Boletus reticuloceps]
MLLGVILSSDKTNITSMTGGHVAHPLLISLANIPMKYHNKASNHVFSLSTLLPITKFIHENLRICTVLNDRLIHHCLDIVLEPLKQAARIGWMMSDPSRNLHLCYTPLASYIVDTPGGDAGMCPWIDLTHYNHQQITTLLCSAVLPCIASYTPYSATKRSPLCSSGTESTVLYRFKYSV